MTKICIVGLDIYQTRIEELNKAYDRTLELNETQLQKALNNIKSILYSSDGRLQC